MVGYIVYWLGEISGFTHSHEQLSFVWVWIFILVGIAISAVAITLISAPVVMACNYWVEHSPQKAYTIQGEVVATHTDSVVIRDGHCTLLVKGYGSDFYKYFPAVGESFEYQIIETHSRHNGVLLRRDWINMTNKP